jgi:drug/metabolite transporter, DME family
MTQAARGHAREGRPVLLVLLAGVLLGTAGTAAALGSDGATPIAVGGLRLAVGAVALLVVMPFLGGSWTRIPALLKRPTIWVMAAGAAAYQPFFFGAVQRSGVAVSTLVAVGSGPVFTGLLGWIFLRQRPNAAWAAATGLAITGLLLSAWGELGIDDALGPLMALAAGLGSACYVVAAKAELDRGGHFVELPGVAYLLGALMLAPLVLSQPLTWLSSTQGWIMVAYLGFVTMALANVLQVVGLRGMPPGPAATLLLADPMTATVLGVVVLGEVVPPLGIIGLVFVLAGLVLQARAVNGARSEEPEPQPAL